MQDIRRVFGARVRGLRLSAGLTQEELAHRAGMHWTYLGGIERGERNPSLLNICRLASALGVAPSNLFVDVGDQKTLKKDGRKQGSSEG